MIIYKASKLPTTFFKYRFEGNETSGNYPSCIIPNGTSANYNWGTDNLFSIKSTCWVCTCSLLSGTSPNICARIFQSSHYCYHNSTICIPDLFKYNINYTMNFCISVGVTGYGSYTNNFYYGIYDCAGCGCALCNVNASSTVEITRCFRAIEFLYCQSENRIYVCDYCTTPTTVTCVCVLNWNIESIRFQTGVGSGGCGGSAGGWWGFRKIANVNTINNLYKEFVSIL